MTIRLAVLASGRGSNLQSILDAIAARALDAELVGVFSDKPDAPALQRVPEPLRWARKARAYPERAAFDAEFTMRSRRCGPTGWSAPVTYGSSATPSSSASAAGCSTSIHRCCPGTGACTHARALRAGDGEHGASVHFVIPELDAGAVIAQAPLPVLAATARNRSPRGCCRSNIPCCWRSLQMAAAAA